MIKNIVFQILGDYTPVMTDSYTTDGAFLGTEVAFGMAGVDWPFIAGCVLLALTLYCVFRIIGSVINNV